MLKRTLMLAAVAALATALIGCNTIHGFGQDMEAFGEGIQDAASE